ncbi:MULTISPECIES: DUF2586 family protein [Porphyromonadaceae]|uniref:DUF2586 family protein n=1 Tax=Porphyromonadaceae TaxID=171551 RepID=UPI000D89419A|nr:MULTISPECIES: DUF2586 family protein [Porphyromonadaceae]MCR9011961.1 DUF2586 family protein [Gabonibacter chumensis]PXZ44916.1 hypothetical protein DMB45_00260 [Sanguibacteroides justesenii]
MGLSDVNIMLENGNLGRGATTTDGVAGLILTGKAVPDKTELNKVYQLSSTRDLVTRGITEENNPLVYKDITAFYSKAGDGAELYLLIVAEATTLTQVCSSEADSPLRKLIDHAKGRIRLVGINKIPPAEYVSDTETTGIDKDVVTAAAAVQELAESYTKQVNPFRVLLPALAWTGSTENLFKPREGSYNRVAFVMAADTVESAAIGQVLGRAASIPVNYSIARVKSGAIAVNGYLTNGKSPEECAGTLEALNDAGYIIYRTFTGKNGYYLNDDCMAAPLSDDYSNLNLGRVIDKAILLAYSAYIDEIQDNVLVDEAGQLPGYLCTYFEGNINNAIATKMQGEISDFESYIDPDQNILSTSRMNVACKIVPNGILREINVTLGFNNPAIKQ